MSKNHFNTILGILTKFDFSFEFSEVQWYFDKDLQTNVPESGLVVNYNNGKGHFKMMASAFNDAEKKVVFEVLDNHKNKISGTIPDELRPKTNLPAAVVKQYKITKGIKYFNRETLQEIVGEIDLTDDNTITCNVVAAPSLPDFVFLKHPPLIKGGAPGSLLYKGFTFSIITDEWKQNGGDAFNIIIAKVTELGTDKMLEMLDKKLKEKKLKPVEPEKPKKQLTQNAPVQVVHLTKDTIKKVVKEITDRIKGTDPDIFDSWGATKFTNKWDGKNSVTVQFIVDGFNHQGVVAVTKDQSTGLYTISCLEGEKPYTVKSTVNKVPAEKVNAQIDFAVEYDCTQDEYIELIEMMYGDEVAPEKEIAA